MVKRLRRYREARGAPNPPRTTPELAAAARAVWTYKLTPDGPLSTELAQQLALSEGAISRVFPVTSLNQAANRLGLNPRASYVRRIEAAHANQAHRVGISGSRHFRLVGEQDGDPILEVCRAEQRNKRWHDAELLWMMAVIDDYSRLLHVAYTVAPGESAERVQRFLVETWQHGPLQGMPEEFLICDCGSFGRDASTRSLLDFFGIELITGQPNNSQRNGRIERPFRPIKEGFERAHLATHKTGTRVRLSVLKEELAEFVRKTNERRHPFRRHHSKLEDWQRGMAFRTLRECPEDALHVATYRQERTVGAEGWVQHGNRFLEIVDLPHGLRGRRITLVFNRKRELVAEHDGARYAVRDAQPVALGSYDAPGLRGRRAPPSAEMEKAAAERPRSGVGAFSKKRQAALRAVGTEPVAPGQPVRAAGRADNVVSPPPRRAPATRRPSPFTLPVSHPDADTALRRLGEIVGRPLHVVLPEMEVMRVRKVLEQFALDRRKTEELGYQLKQIIGI